MAQSGEDGDGSSHRTFPLRSHPNPSCGAVGGIGLDQEQQTVEGGEDCAGGTMKAQKERGAGLGAFFFLPAKNWQYRLYQILIRHQTGQNRSKKLNFS